MYRSILALADTIVVLDELIVRALANYSYVLVFIVTIFVGRNVKVVFLINRVLVGRGVHGYIRL